MFFEKNFEIETSFPLKSEQVWAGYDGRRPNRYDNHINSFDTRTCKLITDSWGRKEYEWKINGLNET
jgi:hypothetical protein